MIFEDVPTDVDRAPAPPADDHGTGLPGFRTWRPVYLAVTILFAVYVVLLFALSKAFA